MEPQGEQAQYELRNWDGSDDEHYEEPFEQTNWAKLLDVYAEVDDEPKWGYLRQPGIRLVQGDGPESAETARVFICGEAPGAVENGAGKPFQGPSGRVIDQLLGLAGLEREQCFITNVLKYRPVGNRTPGYGEAWMGRDALRKEWAIIQPLLTIAVGATAHKLLNPADVALMNFPQGELWNYPGKTSGAPPFVTSVFHPAFAMRNKRWQEPMEEAWEKIGDQIDQLLMPDGETRLREAL